MLTGADLVVASGTQKYAIGRGVTHVGWLMLFSMYTQRSAACFVYSHSGAVCFYCLCKPVSYLHCDAGGPDLYFWAITL